MVMMQPALGMMEVCPLPALNRDFTSYHVDMDRTATRAAAQPNGMLTELSPRHQQIRFAR